MSRCIVNVSTGKYIKGQERMIAQFPQSEHMQFWCNQLPPGSPSHEQVNYGFKAHALKAAAEKHDVLLWCDASIVPGPRPLEDVWQKIEKDGAWFTWSGFQNYQWTAGSAYQHLFPEFWRTWDGLPVQTSDVDSHRLEAVRARNRNIPHVATGAFGIDLRTTTGKTFLEEFLRLAKTGAFNGPWRNQTYLEARGYPVVGRKPRVDYCGPADVEGHRHDQTAASVIAWRLGIEPTIPPDLFAYKGQESEATCLIADGIC